MTKIMNFNGVEGKLLCGQEFKFASIIWQHQDCKCTYSQFHNFLSTWIHYESFWIHYEFRTSSFSRGDLRATGEPLIFLPPSRHDLPHHYKPNPVPEEAVIRNDCTPSKRPWELASSLFPCLGRSSSEVKASHVSPTTLLLDSSCWNPISQPPWTHTHLWNSIIIKIICTLLLSRPASPLPAWVSATLNYSQTFLEQLSLVSLEHWIVILSKVNSITQ